MEIERLVDYNSSNYNGYPHYMFSLPFEKNHDFDNVSRWMEQNWHVSLYIASAYLLLIFGLQRYMKNKPPVDVKTHVMWWNFAVSIFSICGMLRGTPELIYVLKEYGLETSVCNSTMNSVSAFWISIFAFSKVAELADTIFVVLRKRVTSLHLTHHVATLVIVWFFFSERPGLFRWTCIMNYCVHAFMYSYFTLKATKMDVPESVAFTITSMQLLQFVLGVLTSVYCANVILSGKKCSTSLRIAISTAIMNGYLLFIFGKYFVKRYLVGRTQIKGKKAQ